MHLLYCVESNTDEYSIRGKKGKSKAVPLQAWTGFQEVEAPRFQDNRHMKVVRLPALRTCRLYPPGSIPGTHFLLEA